MLIADILINNKSVFIDILDEIDIYFNKDPYSMALAYTDRARSTGLSIKERAMYAEMAVNAIIPSKRARFIKRIGEVWESVRPDKPNKPSTVDRACKMIQGRANVGQVKYGVSIDRDDLSASDWAQHAIEEMLDGAQYLIRLKDEMEALQEENAELKRNQKQESNEAIKKNNDDGCLTGFRFFIGDEVYIYGKVHGSVKEIKVCRTISGDVTALYLVSTPKMDTWRAGKELLPRKLGVEDEN